MPLRYIIVVLFLMLAPISYFVLTSAQNSVIEEMTEASKRDDAAAISARVDWQTLRNATKDDIAAAKKGNVYFGNLGPTAAQIGPVVDHYLREENVPLLFYFHDKIFKGVPEDHFIVSTGYAPPFGFSVTLGYPKVGPGNPSQDIKGLRDRLQVRFVFRLVGTTWKIIEMHMPLFMVPSQPNPLPDLKKLKP